MYLEVDIFDSNGTDATGQNIVYSRVYFLFKKQAEKYALWAEKEYIKVFPNEKPSETFVVSWGGEPLFFFHFNEAFEEE